MLKRIIAAAGAGMILAWGSAVAAPTVPIMKFDPVPVKGASAGKIRQAVLNAGQIRKWKVVSDKSGEILLSYPNNNRATKYQATARVTFRDGFYQVSYHSSRGLDETRDCRKSGDNSIICAHRNVNRWLANLNKDIQGQMM